MAFNVTSTSVSPLKIYNLTNNAYRTLVQGGSVGSHSLDANAIYLTYDDNGIQSNVYYVDGSSSTTAGTWLGTNPSITSYFTGLTIAYKVAVAGVSGGTTLNINNLGAIAIKRNDGNLTTHVPVNSVIILTYDGTYWRWADYSSNSVSQTITTANTNYPILSCYTAATATTTNSTRFCTGITMNPSTKSIKASILYGAVWNDYAEYRNQLEDIEPGYCVASKDNGQIYKTVEKFQACDGIVSDTFGFAIGETDECKTPLAVAGRVLAYCEGDRNDYHAGDTVCAGPEGKVCKMTREEIKEYPDRIIGVVSEIPEYEFWGTGNIAVNGRIWIKVK